jgi:hypothetical protein
MEALLNRAALRRHLLQLIVSRADLAMNVVARRKQRV